MIRFLKRKREKSVVLINLDGFRADTMKYAPFLKHLKQKGVFLSNMVTYAPYTIGSLPAVMTGMYGDKDGVDAYFKSRKFDRDNCYTLAQYLREKGFVTAVDVLNENVVPAQGFDKRYIHDEYKADFIKRHCNIIKEVGQSNKPFFIFLQYSPMHARLVKDVINRFSDFSKEYFDANNREKNLAMYKEQIKQADNYVKEIYEYLFKSNKLDNTLLIIFSDHGQSLGEKIGERAYGVYLYDYTIKVFAFFLSSDLPRGREVDKVTRTIDILPTILELLKIKEKKSYNSIQGKSLVPLVYNKEKEERIAYCETGGLGGPNPSPTSPNMKCVRTQNWKLIYNISTRKKELYNLTNDKYEQCNLVDKNLDEEKYLWEILKREGNLCFGRDY